MSTPAADTAESRRKMQLRLDRARRFYEKISPILGKKEPQDRQEAESERQFVEDCFVAWLGEMKNVRHYFGEWWQSGGHRGAKNANEWMDTQWAVKQLQPDEVTMWLLVRSLRDYDVHHSPIEAKRTPAHFVLRTAAGAVVVTTKGYMFEDMQTKSKYYLNKFCRPSMNIMQRFIDDFDKPV